MSSIAELVVQIRSCKVNKTASLQKIIELTDLIYKEWAKLKKNYKRKLSFNDLKIFLEYEAKEEIIIGLIGLLNEKLINFHLHQEKKRTLKQKKYVI